MPELEVPRGQLLPGTDALDQLGISSWSRGRDWRATGFFNHWVTYSEVLATDRVARTRNISRTQDKSEV